MTIDLDALEKLADEATPGDWAWVGDDLKSLSDSSIVIADLGYDGMWIPTEGADAAFIAAANPATIKALIAEVRSLRARVARWEPPMMTSTASSPCSAFLARNGKGEG